MAKSCVIMCRYPNGCSTPVCTILSNEWDAWQAWRVSGEDQVLHADRSALKIQTSTVILEYRLVVVDHSPHRNVP